jgi:magnesium chelatase subunit D
VLIILTDGRANTGLYRKRSYEGPRFNEIYNEIFKICHVFRSENRIRTIVIDTEEKGTGSFDSAAKLAENLNARYYILENLHGSSFTQAIREEL